MFNCSSIQLNSSNTVLFPNGTLWIPLYATGYSRADYFMNGSNVLLCTKFSSNYSKREIIVKWSYAVSPLQILTYVGCSVSVLSLLVLLVVYSVFKELRTLPGKKSDKPVFCHAILSHVPFCSRIKKRPSAMYWNRYSSPLLFVMFICMDECHGI